MKAKIVERVKSDFQDLCATIAETVRDASRTYPRPTNCKLFQEKAFGINPDELANIIAEVMQRPEFMDIRRIVHPSGAVYLYSSKFLDQFQAWYIMDWEEVGSRHNPRMPSDQ